MGQATGQLPRTFRETHAATTGRTNPPLGGCPVSRQAGPVPESSPSEANLRSALDRNIAAREAAGLPKDLAELVGLLDTFRQHHLGCQEEVCTCSLFAGELEVGLRPLDTVVTPLER